MQTPPSFFTALTSGPAVMFNWHRWLGPDLENTRPFLRPIQELAEIYPCTESSPCGCFHEVFVDEPGGTVAFCTCDEDFCCEKIPLQLSDLIQYQLDLPRLGEAISQLLGLEPLPVERSGVVQQFWRIGRYRHCVVYWSPDPVTLAMAAAILTEPCLIAVSTGAHVTSQVRDLLLRQGCGILALNNVIQLKGSGQLQAQPNAQAILEAALPKAPASLMTTVTGIHQEIATIRTEHRELRASKARLEEMSAKGLFEFTQKVDSKSFKILCTILAEGNVAKASRALGVTDPAVRKHMRQWAKNGPAYQVMLDLVRWRKTISGKEKVPFNPEVFHEKQPTIDYPGLLSDVLDGLLSMTDTNWEDHCAELAELLRPHART
jgi:hypothetical protein